MKYRTDFVTNSSSSSFIIARKDGLTKEEILNQLKDFKNTILEILEYETYLDMEDYIKEAIKNNELDKAVQYIFEEIAENLLFMDMEVQLDDWKATAIEVSSESDEIFDLFLYELSKVISSEHLKIQNCYK